MADSSDNAAALAAILFCANTGEANKNAAMQSAMEFASIFIRFMFSPNVSVVRANVRIGWQTVVVKLLLWRLHAA